MNIGRNILYFRQQQGLTQQQLADVLGINKMAISNYEKGKRQPNIETVKAICKALDISLMQFMAYSEGIELSAGHFQNADLLTTAQKESIESQIRYAAQRYYDACLCANAPCDKCSLPMGKIALPESSAAAEYMRSAIGLPKSGPIGNLTHILENNGIIVVLISPPKRGKFSGYNAISNKGFAIIAIKSNYDGVQQRYSLACELAAMLFHDTDNADLDDIVNHFLLPTTDLRREIGEKRKHLSFGEIRYICEEYAIPPQMVAKRAEQEHIISHSAYQQLLRQIREMQHFVLPQEKPTRLEQMVQRALADGEINEARAAELLNQWQ